MPTSEAMQQSPRNITADRSLRRATIFFLIMVVIAAGACWLLAPNDATPDPAWRVYARFGVAAVSALILLWFGFKLWINLEAKRGDSAVFARPAFVSLGLAAAFVAKSAVTVVLEGLSDPTSVALRGLFLCILVLMAVIFPFAVLPLFPFLTVKMRNAFLDLRGAGSGRPSDAGHDEGAYDSWAAVDAQALKALHKTIMGNEEVDKGESKAR